MKCHVIHGAHTEETFQEVLLDFFADIAVVYISDILNSGLGMMTTSHLAIIYSKIYLDG